MLELCVWSQQNQGPGPSSPTLQTLTHLFQASVWSGLSLMYDLEKDLFALTTHPPLLRLPTKSYPSIACSLSLGAMFPQSRSGGDSGSTMTGTAALVLDACLYLPGPVMSLSGLEEATGIQPQHYSLGDRYHSQINLIF